MYLKYYLSKNKNRIKYAINVFRRKMHDTLYYGTKQKVIKPKVIQLPITHLCNFDCVMCGVPNSILKEDFSAEELRRILSDELFSDVETVGINGGEPFLRKDLIECIDTIIASLPQLSDFYIITNGYHTDKILTSLKIIKDKCKEKKIVVHLSLSLDGIGEIQDFHRGHKGAYDHLEKTYQRIVSDIDKYVDDINIICTITRYNVYYLNDVENWSTARGVEVAYNIATINSRIDNQEKLKKFSIFEDEQARMLTQEFFYKKYMETGSEKYYALFLYVRTQKRYSNCPCMNLEWITLTPDSQIGFCATHSKKLGSALEKSACSIVNENISHLEEIREDFCNTCSHYIYSLNSEGLKKMYEDKMRNHYIR